MQPAVVLVRTTPEIAQRRLFPRATHQFADDFGRLRTSRILRALAKSRQKFQSARLHRGSVFSRPCSRPKFPSRSREESHGQLPRAASRSNERAPRSSVRSFSGKLLEKLGDEIACHRGSVAGGRANIVDGLNFLGYALSYDVDQ